MEKWTERRWWHYSAVLSGCLLLFIVGVLTAVAYHEVIPAERNVIELAGVLVATYAACVGAIVWLSICVVHTQKAASEHALALIEKGSGRMVQAGLQCIQFAPWPFRQQYEARQYPTRFRFSTTIQPITTNPKVIPLSVCVVAALEKHADMPTWFLQYLVDPALGEKAFKYQAFEVFQHRLPQELTSRLNPFDQSSASELKKFFEDQLPGDFPFPIKVERMDLTMTN